MLTIPCPFCGHRSENEFVHGGAARMQRPENPADYENQDWIDYLTHKPNPVGLVSEKWWHVRGCGAWITIQRDTLTHIIIEPEKDSPTDDAQNNNSVGAQSNNTTL